MADYVTGIQWDIGLFERSAIYPAMIGHTRLARTLLRTAHRPHREVPAR
jgi:hypothetical protein